MKTAGFGILEVVVAIGIATIGIMGVTQLISISQKGQSNVSQTIDFDVARSNILAVLNRACDTAFAKADGTAAAYNSPSSALDEIVQKVGAQVIVIAKVGTNLGHGLTLSSMVLNQAVDAVGGAIPDQPNSPMPGFTSHFVSLVIRANKTGGGYGGSEISNANSPYMLLVVTNSTNQIISCGGIPTNFLAGP